jgi:hypothetical protein
MIKDLLLYFALLLWFVVPLQAQPTIFAEDVEGKLGDEIEVLIKTEDFVDVVALQFTFEWDPNVLEFVDFAQFNLIEMDSDNFGPADKTNFIISTWFENLLTPTSFPDGEVLFSMRFNVIGETPDSSMLYFTGSELANVVSINGESAEFNTREAMFRVMQMTNTVASVPDNFDLSISPNPFQSTTQIKFNLEEYHSDFQIAIYALDGREIYKQRQSLSAGEQVLQVDQSMLPSTGMYLVHLTSENLHTTHKLFFENY